MTTKNSSLHRIGILGFGIVGRSLLSFISKPGATQFLIDTFAQPHVPTSASQTCTESSELSLADARVQGGRPLALVWDRRVLTAEEMAIVTACGAQACTDNVASASPVSMQEFVQQCDLVLCSAAVDISELSQWSDRLVSEVDLFQAVFTRPTIAITGTIGKTSLTQLTAELLCAYGTRAMVSGNIGAGLLDLLEVVEPIDYAVLELSSFQLEHNRTFAADIAVITNLHHNHLDRHHTFAAYRAAKLNLIIAAKPGQRVIMPAVLAADADVATTLSRSAVTPLFVAATPIDAALAPTIAALNGSLLDNDGATIRYCSTADLKANLPGRPLIARAIIPTEGFFDNWLSVLGILFLTHGDLSRLTHEMLITAWRAVQAKVGQHRLELCGSTGTIDIFNDSKATVTESVRAAITQLATRYSAITLIVGGLGKGVDRRPAFQSFIAHPAIKSVIAVGQAPDLVGTHTAATLEEAFSLALSRTPAGGAILLSPGGTSFDQFTNYQHRGTVFKQVVTNHLKRLPR